MPQINAQTTGPAALSPLHVPSPSAAAPGTFGTFSGGTLTTDSGQVIVPRVEVSIRPPSHYLADAGLAISLLALAIGGGLALSQRRNHERDQRRINDLSARIAAGGGRRG